MEFGGERMDVHSEIYGGADLMHYRRVDIWEEKVF